jgi:hypothetical protein
MALIAMNFYPPFPTQYSTVDACKLFLNPADAPRPPRRGKPCTIKPEARQQPAFSIAEI